MRMGRFYKKYGRREGGREGGKEENKEKTAIREHPLTLLPCPRNKTIS